MIGCSPRAAEIAVGLRGLIPVCLRRSRPVVDGAGMVGAQCEAAFSALADADDDPESVGAGWTSVLAAGRPCTCAPSIRSRLTPGALGRLGLDLAQAARSEQLRRHIEERYGAGGEG